MSHDPSQYRKVICSVSIDGVGELTEYQQRGATWSEVETNTLRLIRNRDFFTVINYVPTAINALSAMEFVDWAYNNSIGPVEENDLEVNFINISPVSSLDHLGTSALPPELRWLALTRLQQGLTRYHGYSGALAEYHRRAIQKIIGIIENTPWNPDHTARFLNHISQENIVSRKLFAEIVPEWRTYRPMMMLNVHHDRVWAQDAQDKENNIAQYLRDTYPHYYVRLVDSIILKELQEMDQWSGIISDTHVYHNPHPNYHCLAPELWHIFLCDPIADTLTQPDRMFSLSVNRIAGERMLVLYRLAQRGWLDQGHVNFNCSLANSARNLSLKQRRENFDQAHRDLDRPEYQDIYESLRDQMPMLLPNDDAQTGGPDRSALRARVTIVMETYQNQHSVVFSEKIFRALQTPRPWVIFCTYGAVRLLRDNGFDVLDDLVDHGYDTEKEPEQRMDLMLDSVPRAGFDLARCEAAVAHNQEILRRLAALWPERLEKLSQSIRSRHQAREN